MSRILYVSFFAFVMAIILSFTINLSLMMRTNQIQTGTHFSIGKTISFSHGRVAF